MDGLPGACAAGLDEGLAGMLDGARRLCPVETGDLKTSLSARSEAVAGGAEGTVTAGAAHAVYVELGTSRMAARPFLLPACQAERGALLAAVARAVNESRYAGYLSRAEKAARDLERLEDMPVPADIDYAALSGLRLEAREKLARVRPINVGQAARVRGVTPADVNVLLLHIARRGGSV